MRDKFEEYRLMNRARGIWAVVTLLVGYLVYVSHSALSHKWVYIIIGLGCGAIALFIIIRVTRREN